MCSTISRHPTAFPTYDNFPSVGDAHNEKPIGLIILLSSYGERDSGIPAKSNTLFAVVVFNSDAYFKFDVYDYSFLFKTKKFGKLSKSLG